MSVEELVASSTLFSSLRQDFRLFDILSVLYLR